MIDKAECADLEHNFTKKIGECGYRHWGVIYYESRDYLCSSPGAIIVHVVLIGINSDDYSTLSAHENAIYAGQEIKVSVQEAREKCFEMLKEKIKEKSETFLPCGKCDSEEIEYVISPGDDTLVEGCVWVDVKCKKCGELAHFSVHPKTERAVEIVRNWNNMRGKMI